LMSGHAARAQAAAAPAGGTVELETIDVKGQARAGTAYEAATGPVRGFTATESTAGTKTGTPIVDTPASISVVGQPQIQATGSQTLPEALRYTPGVFANQFGFTPSTDFLLVRGFNVQDVGYYLDGLQLYSYAFAAFQVEPWGLERFDVLRGPASALYGGSGPGGIIDSISKRPTSVPYHRVEIGVNNFGNAYGAFDLSGPAAPGSPWSYRVAALGKGGGTQVDHFDYDRGFVAPSLSYRPDGTTTLTFLGQYQRDFTQASQFLPYEGTVRPAPYGRISTSLFTGDTAVSRFDREQSFMGYTFEHSFADGLTVRQNLRYAYVDTHEIGPYGVGYTTTPASAELQRYNFITTDRGREFTLDNQAQARLDLGAVHQTFLAGLDVKHFIINDDDGSGAAAPLNVLHPVYGTVAAAPNTRYTLATETQNDVGLYAQDEVRLGRFVALLGAREDFVDTSVNNLLYPAQSTDGTPHALTGRAGLLYTTDWGVNPYAAYGTSFNPIVGINTTTQQAFRPEEGDTKEVGVKYQAPTLPITASLALFDVTRTNVLTADPSGMTSTQTGEERSRGIELQANATLAEGLKAVGSFTAFHITNTRDLDPSIVGKVPYDTPETLSSLFVDYTIPDG
ncbi:TonB-dependent siderophore receptor, partial [Jatrophihabitans endophyticus]|uniref:TonB-dependent siderophore receptor n=1 Tax=Jatrophihabitans endophyticus TaxID=1206085 RepID=UPI0019F681B2